MPRLAIFLALAAGGLLLSSCSGGSSTSSPTNPSSGGTATAGGAPAGAGSSTGGAGSGTAGATAGGGANGSSGGASQGGSAGSSGGAPAAGSAGTAGTAGAAGVGAGGAGSFVWPDQKIAAVTLTYDDGLDGQLKYVVPVLDAAGLKGTFFLASFQGVPHIWALPNTTDPLNERHQAWQAVLAGGHELGSHTVYHPCDNNNPGYQPADYDLTKMAAELDDSIARLMRLGATAPFTFGYPCGGDRRGIGPADAPISYMPLVSERFLAARVSQNGLADPTTVDLQATPEFGTTDATGAELIAHVDEAIAAGSWALFIFHGVGPEAPNCDINTFDLDACALNYLTTPSESHQELIDYLVSKQNEVWTATFKDVAGYVQTAREP